MNGYVKALSTSVVGLGLLAVTLNAASFDFQPAEKPPEATRTLAVEVVRVEEAK